MAWCADLSDFQVNVFPSKVPEFLRVLFNLVVKHSAVFLLALLHSLCTHQYFVLVFLRNKVQSANQPKKYRGMFTT